MYDATLVLKHVPRLYVDFLDGSGIILKYMYMLKPLMAAIKVLVNALTQSGLADGLEAAERYRADVEETEAILAAYSEGVLEETRRELAERRRAAMAAGVAVAVDTAGPD